MAEKLNSAFPHYTGDMQNWHTGMTLRDWFAGQTVGAYMQWSLSRPPNSECFDRLSAASKYASVAYEIADAMIAARNNASNKGE